MKFNWRVTATKLCRTEVIFHVFLWQVTFTKEHRIKNQHYVFEALECSGTFYIEA